MQPSSIYTDRDIRSATKILPQRGDYGFPMSGPARTGNAVAIAIANVMATASR
jgi:hypothetical protein